MSTFVERLLGGKAGTVVTVEPDWIVINDGVSHAAVEEISAVAKPEKVRTWHLLKSTDVLISRQKVLDISIC